MAKWSNKKKKGVLEALRKANIVFWNPRKGKVIYRKKGKGKTYVAIRRESASLPSSGKFIVENGYDGSRF